MNINIKKRLTLTSCAALMAVAAFAQDQVKISGKIVDQNGEPIPGASVIVEGTTIGTVADLDGNYSISVPAGKSVTAAFVGYNQATVAVADGNTVYNITLTLPQDDSEFVNQPISNGAFREFARKETTGAVSVITNKDVDRRSAKNIGNSIIGEGNGLVSLQGSGTYYEKNPTFYVRGLQSLNHNTPLILVDGIERDINTVSPKDVEEVQILKDAAALALYGYKGVSNAILVKTKRGKNESTNINVGFEYVINGLVEKPKFVDGPTYAKARNEALAYEGMDPEFSEQDIKALESGEYPYYFPNVDWVGETFKDKGTSRLYNIEFTGGGKRFKYFTSLNLIADDGFVKNPDENYGYSTQDMYSRGNIRNNLDIKLTDYTNLQINIAGVISEMSKPGNGKTNLWEKVYSVPSLAFPIKSERGHWGGNAKWVDSDKNGLNPLAWAQGSAYYKIHERGLWTDVVLDQSLETFVEGLALHGRLAYDTYSTLYEDHAKAFTYGMMNVQWVDGKPVPKQRAVSKDDPTLIDDYYNDGVDGEMGAGANTDNYKRRGDLFAGVSFDREIADGQKLYAQAQWDFDFTDDKANSSTLYKQDVNLFAHYGINDKYFVDVTLDASGSNRLAPDHKWNFSPTFAAAWVLSNEDFLRSSDLFNFLKLRASFGRIASDWLPRYKSNNVWYDDWTYYTQSYSTASSYYPLGADYSYGESASRVDYGRMAAEDPKTEKALKFNVGIDARLLNCLDLELDFYRQVNKDAWVSGAGAYTAVIGFGAPFVNQGESKSQGIEIGLDFNKQFGAVNVNLGGNFNYSTSEIVDMAEELRAFPNLVQTGNPLNSNYGLIALGLFKDEADIAASPVQTFTTVRPGDIKYKDVNGDGQIDANDECKIGYSGDAPEINYNFHVGAEVAGVGLFANFQGVAHYSAYLDANGYYHGLYANRNLSQEAYDGRWKPGMSNADFPRLCASENTNNFRKSTFWLKDRSYFKLRNVELYYDFKNLLEGKKVVNGAKLFVRGIDLFTKDKIDNKDAAVLGVAAPSTRSFVVGFNMTF